MRKVEASYFKFCRHKEVILEYSVSCPAKINLFLHVVNKRPDGYHNIGTLFQKLAVSDHLTASPSGQITLDCNEKLTDSPTENLVCKAASAIQKEYGISRGVHFTLQKKLPAGAGLGGGSSDAAGAIRLCEKIWNLSISIERRRAIGLSLGADVPFFLSSTSCFATGVGEKLEPAPSPPKFYVVILTPFCHVNTSKAYQMLHPRGSDSEYLDFKAQYSTPSTRLKTLVQASNDFQKPVFDQYPEIKSLFANLTDFNPLFAMLSGSGSSVFGLFEQQAAAESCKNALSLNCRFSCVTQFLLEIGKPE